MNNPLSIHLETFIAAPPAAVFAYLTDPEKLVGWMGSQAELDARPGGLYLLKGIGHSGATARGAFREVVPIHRLAYTFGWDGRTEVPPGSSVVEFDLVDQDGGTLLRMTHSDLPNAEQCAAHKRGWTHYFQRLSSLASGQDPGVDAGPSGIGA
jgi:uncharacterized protein YndB with AHSA1/START domain